jgi:predicted DNA-binding transcriptional regulator AlpA
MPANPRTNTIDPDAMIQARAVADRYGISTRTLDRWLQKDHVQFPRPAMLMHDISGRVCVRLWRIRDLTDWERANAARHAQAAE